MSFAEVAGQENAAEFFRRAVAGGRLAHAYILVGAEGSGKRAFVRALGQFLFCESANGDACGACRRCRLIARGEFADFHWYARHEDKAQLTVDVIEALRAEIHLKPRESDRKVFVIEDADKLNPAGANKLLKVLEEPPPRSLLVLLALDVRDFLPTILSRCHVVRMRPMSAADLAERLRRENGASPEDARYLSHFTMGSPGLASDLAGTDFARERDWLIDLAAGLTPGDHFIPAEELFKQASGPGDLSRDRRETLLRFLDVITLFYRDVLAAACGADETLINEARRREIEALAGRIGVDRSARILDRIAEARQAISFNANQKLLLDNLTFDVAQLQSG